MADPAHGFVVSHRLQSDAEDVGQTLEAVQQQAAIVEELQISLAEEESLIQELKLLAQSGELKKVRMRPHACMHAITPHLHVTQLPSMQLM